MKKLIIPVLAIATFTALSACKTDVVEKEPSVHSSTTSTEESSTRVPASATTTTETRSSN